MNKRNLYVLAATCFLLNSVMLSAQTDTSKGLSEKNYRLYSMKLSKEVSMKDIAEDMKNYDVVFYGEEHNDSVTHYAEKTLFKTLYDKYNSTMTLSMEMFERDEQEVMNEYLGGFIREKEFKHDARAWSNYKDYRPMVELAKEEHLDVICANSPGRYGNLAGRKGEKALESLPDASKKYFAPLPYDTATGMYYEKLQEMSGHASVPAPKNDSVKRAGTSASILMMPFDLVAAQSLWDASMAYSISEYLKVNPGKKIMQVNGKFHSEQGYGIVEQLKKYSPKTRILIVTSMQDDRFPGIDWVKYKDYGDYILITDPKVPKTFKD